MVLLVCGLLRFVINFYVLAYLYCCCWFNGYFAYTGVLMLWWVVSLCAFTCYLCLCTWFFIGFGLLVFGVDLICIVVYVCLSCLLGCYSVYCGWVLVYWLQCFEVDDFFSGWLIFDDCGCNVVFCFVDLLMFVGLPAGESLVFHSCVYCFWFVLWFCCAGLIAWLLVCLLVTVVYCILLFCVLWVLCVNLPNSDCFRLLVLGICWMDLSVFTYLVVFLDSFVLGCCSPYLWLNFWLLV